MFLFLELEKAFNTNIIKRFNHSLSENIIENLDNNKFNQWLAGLIDGDGCIQLSNKGYSSLEIVMENRDIACLEIIVNKIGGKIEEKPGVNWVRYRLHSKQGILNLINIINGEVRNPVRLNQLEKICNKYNISLIRPEILTYNNAWFSGMFDSDGSVYFNLKSSQLYISVAQKEREVLDILCEKYKGSVYNQKNSFKWTVYKKSEVLELLEYFKLNLPKSAKKNRILAIESYFNLKNNKAHLAPEGSSQAKAWNEFTTKWKNWE